VEGEICKIMSWPEFEIQTLSNPSDIISMIYLDCSEGAARDSVVVWLKI
jgi:hypothetical protein